MSDGGAVNQQHRLWDASVWWTRFGAILGLATILYGGWMSLNLATNVGSCDLPHHLKHPGLAIEVAHDWNDAAQIVGVCEGSRCFQDSKDSWCTYNSAGHSKIVCEAKIRALVRQQKMDYIFIVLYALFFVYIGIINIRFARISATLTGKDWLVGISGLIGVLGGLAALTLALFAAFWDWRENGRILQALSQISNHICYGNNFPDMRMAAYYKWRSLFIAIGCGSPIFLFWPGRTSNWRNQERLSLLSFALAWLTALTALTAGVHRNFRLPLWPGPTSRNSDWHSLFGAAAGCSYIGLRSTLARQHTRIVE